MLLCMAGKSEDAHLPNILTTFSGHFNKNYCEFINKNWQAQGISQKAREEKMKKSG